MKILAFAATSSTTSINKQLVSYAVSQVKGVEQGDIETEVIDINDYELPLYSEDREAELGQPERAKAFLDKIGNSDAIIISFAKHNGSYTSAYKNIFDWASRINRKVFQSKPMVLLAAAPGPGGASSVLTAATASAPFFDGVVKASFSLPGFYDNFDSEQGSINNDELNMQLLIAVNSLLESAVVEKPQAN